MEYCLPRIITTRLMSVQRQWVVKGLRNKANLLIRAYFFVGGFCNSNCKNSISQNIYKYTSLFLTKYYKSAILITFHPQTWEYFIHLLIVLRPKSLIIISLIFSLYSFRWDFSPHDSPSQWRHLLQSRQSPCPFQISMTMCHRNPPHS